MVEAVIESGFAKVEAGEWLCGQAQPAACRGTAIVTGLKGFIVPDRAAVRRVAVAAASSRPPYHGNDGRAGSMTPPLAWFGSSDAPFLTRLDALPDEPLHLVSSKLLVAPFAARVGAKSLKLVPFSFQRSTAVTDFKMGWAVAATRSRVTRVALADGETLTVRPEALVAWTGNRPTGFCPKLSVLDILLPRGPKNLTYSFHGPAVVWFEGSGEGRAASRPWRKRRCA